MIDPIEAQPPTGEPDAGDPQVRFGGRGSPQALPTPIIHGLRSRPAPRIGLLRWSRPARKTQSGRSHARRCVKPPPGTNARYVWHSRLGGERVLCGIGVPPMNARLVRTVTTTQARSAGRP